MGQTEQATLYRNDDGARVVYDSAQQEKGSGKVVLTRMDDGFVARFTPDRVVHLFRTPVQSEPGYKLAKRVYDRCMVLYRDAVTRLHEAYLLQKGFSHPSRLTWRPQPVKKRRCHMCRHLIAPAWHFTCSDYGWNVCTKCGSCGEGYDRRDRDTPE